MYIQTPASLLLSVGCTFHFPLRVQIMFWKRYSMPRILKIERPVAGDTANINTAIGIAVGVTAVTRPQSSPVVKLCWQSCRQRPKTQAEEREEPFSVMQTKWAVANSQHNSKPPASVLLNLGVQCREVGKVQKYFSKVTVREWADCRSM